MSREVGILRKDGDGAPLCEQRHHVGQELHGGGGENEGLRRLAFGHRFHAHAAMARNTSEHSASLLGLEAGGIVGNGGSKLPGKGGHGWFHGQFATVGI